MARILVVNPNSSVACSDGIATALAPFHWPGAPQLEVVTLREGPPAIYDWRDWHSVVDPLCRLIEREPAAAYVIACASDPGIEAARAITPQPVFGVFRCAVAAAAARTERFGVIAIVDASKARHLAALRAMGLESRLAAEVALNVTMETLLQPEAARDALINAGRTCAKAGAGAVERMLPSTPVRSTGFKNGTSHRMMNIFSAGGIDATSAFWISTSSASV